MIPKHCICHWWVPQVETRWYRTPWMRRENVGRAGDARNALKLDEGVHEMFAEHTTANGRAQRVGATTRHTPQQHRVRYVVRADWTQDHVVAMPTGGPLRMTECAELNIKADDVRTVYPDIHRPNPIYDDARAVLQTITRECAVHGG